MSETMAAIMPEIAGVTADRVLTPQSLDELRTMLATSAAQTLLPSGGGTFLQRGRPPGGPFAVLDVRAVLGGQADHQADDLTVLVPAGMTIEELNTQLAPSGQWVPLDPPLPRLATLGGTLATGINGPLRSRFGLARDLVLGMTVMRADGELVKAGGRVVKNVTGYDLMRLWCGSHGTLGIITEVALRALPRAATVTLSADYPSPQEIAGLARTLSTRDLRPEFADAIRDDERWVFVVRVAESATGAAKALLHDAQVEEDATLYERSRDLGTSAEDSLALSVSTTLGRVASLTEAVAALNPTECVMRPLAGVVRASWDAAALPPVTEMAPAIDRLRSQVSEVQGSVIIDRMPATYHANIDPWGPPPGSWTIMRKLKSAYDPDGRLNRGRFIGGI